VAGEAHPVLISSDQQPQHTHKHNFFPQTAADAAAKAAAAAAEAATQQAAATATPKQQQQQQQAVDSDEDIFGDAGTDYVPEIPVKKRDAAAAAAAAAAAKGGYFDTRDDMADLPPPPPTAGQTGGGEADMDIEDGELPGSRPPPPPPPQWAVPEEAPKWVAPKPKQVSAATKALLKTMGEDAYSEFFPEAGAAAGSDDEGEEGTKKEGAEGTAAAGGAKKGKPGAMSDVKRKEQKLDGQLGKIKQMFEEKGFGNEAAFKKQDRLEVGQTPMRKRPRI